MKNWKEERNYRRIKNKDGEIIANIITVDGVDVEVTDEVFLAYSQMNRQERYQEEQRTVHPQVSIELLSENYVPIDLYIKDHELSAEEIVLQKEAQREEGRNKVRLMAAMKSLDQEELALLQALYVDGISAREYAKQRGFYHRTVLYRRDKLLKKLRKKFRNKFYPPYCFFGNGVKGEIPSLCSLKIPYQQYG